VKVIDSPGQIIVALLDILTEGATGFVTMMLMELLISSPGSAQDSLLVKVQVTTLVFVKVELVKTGEFVPTFIELTFHCYIGFGPSFSTVAVKVTEAFWQMVVDVAVMDMLGTHAPEQTFS